MDQPVVLGRRYRLVERIGAGGMAVVWRAFDELLHRTVAVKMLSPILASQPDNLRLLRAEALAVAGLTHPRITSVYDYGQQRLHGHEQPYLVMELVDGVTLRQALQENASGLDWQDAVSITAQVAAALAEAHVRGIVHRDVTPANIMLTAAGVKVLDFGICVLSGFDDGQDDELLGTVDYIAPERVTGRSAVTPASDVYSLGMVLYRCLSGRLPWDLATPAQRLRQHVFSPPDALPVVPGMPAAVMELCLSCLAKNPADRPTAAEIAAGLDHWTVPELRAARSAEADEHTRLLALPVELTRRDPQKVAGVAGRLAASVRAMPARRRVGLSAGVVAVTGLVGALVFNTGLADIAGATQVPTPPDVCQVGLQIHVVGAEYTASLAVSTAHDHPQPWRLTFTVDGWQVRGDRPGTVRQDGHRAVVTGHVDLAAGSPVAIGLAGTGRVSGAAPAEFALDGTTCQSSVNVFSTVPSPVPAAEPTPVARKPVGAPEPHGKPKPKKAKP
ncbi:serine/threonine-protein kinase [Catellatospora sichuanensis]|uniref:serine/threonine-protein kinase n=1 Tax=Catellatospora sichuanensis TaxID=1969805 RepID=UPI0011836D56|nr:serine/threonine-protein kinase [Catellatospora sichuanensis]